MLFNSHTFLAFFAVVLVLRFVLPWKLGRWMLVLASYFFYGMANPWYCLLLFTSTAVDFVVAQLIEATPVQRKRKLLLALSVVVNLSLLGVFKYGNFLILNYNAVSGLFGAEGFPLMNIIMPVGISFYTFQTLAYTIDVYRGDFKATKDFGAFALYVSFFPQLVAGPIERARNLLPQLMTKQPVTRQDLEEGFQRILWGLTKKLVIADRLALMVYAVYKDPAGASAPELLAATLGFCYQVYLDFSGYTDIALGTARMMGVRLSENFKWPFLCSSPQDFWARWHLTLTAWFRDYLFKSLGGGKRSSPARTVVNMLITMALMGLWHGPAWHFVVFGLWCGVGTATHQLLRVYLPRKKRGPLFGKKWWSRPLGHFFGFWFVPVAMVFFRSPTMKVAWEVFSGVVTHPWTWNTIYNTHLVILVAMWLGHLARGIFMQDREHLISTRLPALLRGAFWLIMVLLIIFGSVEVTQKFIYFQF